MTFKWGLFRHNPCIVANATDRNAPMWLECSCGWSTLPVPRPFTQALLDAEQHHLDEVHAAIAAWRASEPAGI